jgi:periplasmic protein CpxP/Spy
MIRKAATLSLVLFVLSVLSVYAQDGPGGPGGQRQTPEERMAAQIKTLTEKLTLTEDQVTKIKVLYTKNNEEMAKVREEMQAGGDREAMMAAMQKSRTELNKKIEALLDDKQKEAFAKYNKELDAERAKRQRPPQQ